MTPDFNCLVMMKFDHGFDDVYAFIKRLVRHGIRKVTIDCHRVDENHRGGWITKEIQQAIADADFCIADVTDLNANVMWEVGYAMALAKPAILLTQKTEELPFNLKTYRTVQYTRDALSTTLEPQLKNFVRETVAQLNDADHLLDRLRRTLPLKEHHFRRQYTGSRSRIVSLLVNHHLAPYQRAVESARQSVLPLPSFERMQLAIDAIERAKKEVRAITILANDQWQMPSSKYVVANCAAASRITVRRLVVVGPEDRDIPPQRCEVISSYREAGVHLHQADRRIVQQILDEAFRRDFPLENVLIVDDSFMTRSTASNHGGDLVLAPDMIAESARIFDALWDDPRLLGKLGIGVDE